MSVHSHGPQGGGHYPGLFCKGNFFLFFSFGIALEKTIFISSDLWIKSLKADCLLGEILFPLWAVCGGRMCTAKSVSFFPCEPQSLDVV